MLARVVESDTLGAALDDVLKEFGVEIHVVAHTPLSTIAACYDGKLLAVDLERPATEVAPRVGRRGRSLPGGKVTLDGPPEPF